MYYAGTVLLRMSEKQFWCRTTPRKLSALIHVYNVTQGGEDKDKDKGNDTRPTHYIDQVL